MHRPIVICTLVNKSRYVEIRFVHLVRCVNVRCHKSVQIRFQWFIRIDREAGENLILSVNDSVAGGLHSDIICKLPNVAAPINQSQNSCQGKPFNYCTCPCLRSIRSPNSSFKKENPKPQSKYSCFYRGMDIKACINMLPSHTPNTERLHT